MPGNQPTKADLDDASIVDVDELRSDGTLAYLSGVTVASTTSGTKTVVVSRPPNTEGLMTGYDAPVAPKDIAVITGTSGGLGNGTFTVASVVDDDTFTVVEAIGTSTGGSVTFKYRSGALNVGFDPTGLANTTSTNVQAAVVDVSKNARGFRGLFMLMGG